MKIVFAGSPEYAVPSLNALVEAGKEVVAVLTQPDKPTGRKRTLTPTPVKARAIELGIPVYDFARVRDHAEEIASIGADIMITCAYGQILTDEILKAFPSGVWNLHASLLPEFRGASPIQSAILAGKTHTGVTVMRTELSLDTGDILLVKRCETGGATYGELSEKLSRISAEAATEAVNLLEAGDLNLILQDEAAATYCKKITKAEAKIDFSRTADEVARAINAYSPEPAAYAYLSGAPVNFFKAEAGNAEGGEIGEVTSADKKGITVKCGGGAVKILSLQLAGGKVIFAADAVNGRKIKAGDRFE